MLIKLDTKLPIWYTWVLYFFYKWTKYAKITVEQPQEKERYVYDVLLPFVIKEEKIRNRLWIKFFEGVMNEKLTPLKIAKKLKYFTYYNEYN